MSDQISITLSNNLSERVRHLAQQRHEDNITVVEQILNEALPTDNQDATWLELSEPDEAVDREMRAYIALHPQLKQTYFGKHVAIYHGQLIDHDDNFDVLYDRVDQAYPKRAAELRQYLFRSGAKL